MERPWLAEAQMADRLAGARREARSSWLDDMVAEARLLGDAWIEDECSFCDVTLGMARLSRRVMAHDERRPSGPSLGRVLISPMPGDQHSFGTQLVGLALREAGWDVTADIEAEEDALLEAVAATRFVAVGLSVGHERALDRVAPLVRALRRVARGGMLVALGGPMLNGRPDRARALGADVHVDDARDLSDALLAHARVPA